MPTVYGQIRTHVWSDDEWTSLPWDAQGFYWMLASQKRLTILGILEQNVNRLADRADTTVEEVRRLIGLLEDREMIMHDEETGQILVRAYMRSNEAWKAPKAAGSILNAVSDTNEVSSPLLRSVILAELERIVAEIPENTKLKDAPPIMRRACEVLRGQGVNPWTKGSSNPSDIPSGNPSPIPYPDPSGNPSGNPSGMGLITNNPKPLTLNRNHTPPFAEEPIQGELIGGEPFDDAHASPSAITPNQPSGAVQKRGKGRDYPEDFEEFWAVYPRREDKAAAFRSWKRAIKRADPATVLAGAVRFRDDPNLPEPQYRKHAATWLNNDCWENPPLPERNADRRTFEQMRQENTNRAVAQVLQEESERWNREASKSRQLGQ